MRSESEMMNIICSTARKDKRIRAVILNGSRANPEAPKDCFQDYDIVYIANDINSFKEDTAWIDRFGDRLILQMPNSLPQDKVSESGLVYLMQFCDGNRMDLTICTQEQFQYRKDVNVVLLDKDETFKSALKDPSIYYVKKPTQVEFDACCNEFWWINLYVAKGLWRKELSYAKWYMDTCLREQLILMLGWYCGIEFDFQISIGKLGKYLKKYVSSEIWRQFENTYVGSGIGEQWIALDHMNTLFHLCAMQVSKELAITYNIQEEEQVRLFIDHIQRMKEDAQKFFL